MRPFLRAGWTRWCAAIVLALLAVSMLHAAAPHSAAQRDCATCKALSSPGVAQVPGDIGRPAGEPSQIAAFSSAFAFSASARYLRPLRAPPSFPVL